MNKKQYIQPESEMIRISAESGILQASLIVFDLFDGVEAENYDDVILGVW